MKLWTLLDKSSIRRHKLAAVTATLIAAGTFSAAHACDYCDQGDGGIVCDSGCDACCDSRGSMGFAGPVCRALDKFAGRVEKALGFDKCGSSCGGCDVACDAAVMADLLVPMESAPAPQQHAAPVMPTVPPESYPPHSAPYAESYAEPYAESYAEPAEPYADPVPMEPRPDPAPSAPAMPEPQPEPGEPAPLPPVENNEEGSIFDSLQDPFGDDEVRYVPRTRGLMQTTSLRKWTPQIKKKTPSSRYMHGNTTKVARSHQPKTHSSRSHSASLKRAATRQTAAKTSAAPHANRNRATRSHVNLRPLHHQHLSKRASTSGHQPVARHPHPTSQHQPVTHHQPIRQVQLSKAPAPRRAVRQPIGQRHTALPVGAYGHTNNR